MRKFGWFLIIYSLIIASLHLWVIPILNLLQWRDHAIKTIATFGGTQQYCYDFRPPFDFFEYFILGSLALGLIIIFLVPPSSTGPSAGRGSRNLSKQ